MAGSSAPSPKRLLHALMALCMAACFLVSGHPIVVSLGQEATCCVDDACCCTAPGAVDRAAKSCCTAPAVGEPGDCCAGAEAGPDTTSEKPSGPAWQSRCLCGGDGPVVVVLGSPVRFGGTQVEAGSQPKIPCGAPLNVDLAPKSWNPEPKSPVPWKKWA